MACTYKLEAFTGRGMSKHHVRRRQIAVDDVRLVHLRDLRADQGHKFICAHSHLGDPSKMQQD